MFPQKTRSIEELQELVQVMAWNNGFGCYTRTGFETLVWPEIAERARWFVYFDVDNVHALNEAHGGYDAVDAMIHQCLAILRLTDYVAGQWKSGDEFLICVVETDAASTNELRDHMDPETLVRRLTDELKKQGMSASFAIVPVISRDLAKNIEPAIEQVYALKKQRAVGR